MIKTFTCELCGRSTNMMMGKGFDHLPKETVDQIKAFCHCTGKPVEMKEKGVKSAENKA